MRLTFTFQVFILKKTKLYIRREVEEVSSHWGWSVGLFFLITRGMSRLVPKLTILHSKLRKLFLPHHPNPTYPPIPPLYWIPTAQTLLKGPFYSYPPRCVWGKEDQAHSTSGSHLHHLQDNIHGILPSHGSILNRSYEWSKTTDTLVSGKQTLNQKRLQEKRILIQW